MAPAVVDAEVAGQSWRAECMSFMRLSVTTRALVLGSLLVDAGVGLVLVLVELVAESIAGGVDAIVIC